MRRSIVLLLMIGFLTGCGSTVNVEQERATLMRLDREWAASVKDMDKFMLYYAADASIYPPGMPMATGSAAIREVLTKMSSTPGFSLQFAPAKAEVGASGDVGYTTGTYQASMHGMTEKGKYVEIWKKQTDGQWKVTEDIFNPDGSGAAPTSHVMVESASIKWGAPPPSLPPGSKMAVISGDPSKAGPFVVRAQVPAGYKVAPHWHPGDENLTVLSGTVALGMGDTWDESKMQPVGSGGFVALPAGMRHSFLAKTASTFQVHGMGPFVLNYVNPADDPSKK
jgi:ketosteroid isomerase-like protein/quercetin dioxygenase-like cupin family protein